MENAEGLRGKAPLRAWSKVLEDPGSQVLKLWYSVRALAWESEDPNFETLHIKFWCVITDSFPNSDYQFFCLKNRIVEGIKWDNVYKEILFVEKHNVHYYLAS